MQLRTLVIGGVVAVALVAVRRHAQSEAPSYKRAPTVAKRDARVPVEKLRRAAALPVLDVEVEGEYDEAPDPDAEIQDPEVQDLETVFGQAGELGALQGIATDRDTGEKLVGVTVIVSSQAMAGTQAAITDENGWYRITNLPPGTYLVTFYYLEYTQEHLDKVVAASTTTPVFAKLDTSSHRSRPEVIEDITIDVEYRKDIIVGRTFEGVLGEAHGQGITIDPDYVKNVYPIERRTFESVLGEATPDGQGISFSSSHPIDNVYIVEEPSSDSNEFIEEIEVIGNADIGGY